MTSAVSAIALFKGTNGQLAANKLLEAHGLTDKDARFINMDTATYRAALVTGDMDGAFESSDRIGPRDQGAVKIVSKSAGDPRFLRHCSFVGSEWLRVVVRRRRSSKSASSVERSRTADGSKRSPRPA